LLEVNGRACGADRSPNGLAAAVSGGEPMVPGKLLLTFGGLPGLPVIDLWLMRRHIRSASRQPQTREDD